MAVWVAFAIVGGIVITTIMAIIIIKIIHNRRSHRYSSEQGRVPQVPRSYFIEKFGAKDDNLVFTFEQERFDNLNVSQRHQSTQFRLSEDLERLPITFYQKANSSEGVSQRDQNTCGLCIRKLLHGAPVRIIPCKHWFHAGCLDNHLLNISSCCPICNLNLYTSPIDNDECRDRG
ncbi:E3 ubiquitin-protein ligase SDIR1 [Zancudomyces culisetae]|uniref:E3 ubiquitin-protein ligase SDIR1 n=1 Tax=Zancudomyces culisetae TaxID=1213189 RepID=A0A1R1PW24_ZANCU|nr:E3 ubiquitin-protein ligase SDIR1 [Zancudomyces culisetae]|eukprot:OMH85148.1 E3 ubiquitin-protein ligase SDIR1 [Zancudomyces culisetae]